MRVKRNMKQSLKNSTRHLTGVIKIIILSLIIITLYTKSTSALTYQDSVDVSFTFAPTLSISLSSSNISIDNLSPGNYAHSNTVAINVSTNNVYGYTLTAKVGDDGGASGTSANSNLVNTSTSTSFTSLASNDNLTLSSFSPNTWGYTTSNNINNGTTTYSGLLYDTDTTINMTKNSAGAALGRFHGSNITNFTVGASAGAGQLAGEYTNIITFTAVTNVDVPSLCNPVGTTIASISCMQDINDDNKASVLASMTEGSVYTLIDRRDESDYTVRKINGLVWMTQNLRLVSSVTSEYSDFSTNSTFDPCFGSLVGTLASANSSVESRCRYSGDEIYGTYYNYYAASAGTITTSEVDATESICPSGWKMPSLNDANGVIDYMAEFSPVSKGWYYLSGNNYHGEDRSYWWISDEYLPGDGRRRVLAYIGDTSAYLKTANTYRYCGLFIRCVLR